MAKDGGWFKVYRSITESARWKSRKPFDERSAIIDLLALANYADTKFCPNGMQSFTIPAGTVFRSVPWLSEKWGWTEKKVRRFLQALSDEGFVRVEGTPFGTLIHIQNKGLGMDNVQTTVQTTVHTTDQMTVQSGVQTTVQLGVQHKKKGNNDKESQEEQEPKNTAKRSGFDWGNLE